MSGSVSLELSSQRRSIPSAGAVEAASAPTSSSPAVQVDFAQVFGDCLVVYGWIFGFATQVARAEIRHGDAVIDLLSVGTRLARPDVTKHFTSRTGATDDEHGFCLLLISSELHDRPDSLALSVTLRSGESTESRWPVGKGAAPVIAFFQQHQTALQRLLLCLDPTLTRPLRELLSPTLPLAAALPTSTTLLPFQYSIDLCCILGNRVLLIVGWLIDPDGSLEAAHVRMGAVTWDFFDALQRGHRPDISAERSPDVKQETGRIGFTFAVALADVPPPADELLLSMRTRSGVVWLRQPLCANPARAADEFVSLLGKLEPDTAIDLIEHVVASSDGADSNRLKQFLLAQHGLAVMRLPISLEWDQARIFLHLDRVVPIGTAGIFLNGWFSSETDRLARVACHNGLSHQLMSDNWTRHARKDVATHLAKLGIACANNEHGFACYVTLKNQGTPYFVSVTTATGRARRLRCPTATPLTTPLETVRAVLTSFDIRHRALLSLLDAHVGPAVRTAWASRDTSARKLALQRYGPQPPKPSLSIIVPLYGRFDLAEYQLAQFANDAELRELELIYFVDDPAIYDDFLCQCADLHELYEVPFMVAFCGINLGFAGANNSAARIASAPYLLLMNSDVFPRRPGWALQMLEIYKALEAPGLLGCKLLFEDGSVQHAGMSFRRHAPWSNLWINSHPYKGQTGAGLSGVREVDAVTAACVMVEAALYRQLGGFSEDYIVGDFEDSDLCLRVAAAGRRNRVALDVEMYHIERQSQDRIGDVQWRTNLTVYNCWQHNQRWARHLAEERQ